MKLTLLPAPKSFKETTSKSYKLDSNFAVLMDCDFSDIFTLRVIDFCEDVTNDIKGTLTLTASKDQKNPVFLKIVQKNKGIKNQGYKLTSTLNQMVLEATDEAGAFYGLQTIKQILQQTENIPQFIIKDEPEFSNRGMMLDVSRNKIPTMESLKDYIRFLSHFKINQLQLYFEHSFAYSEHEKVWKDASPFTSQEILEIDAYCRSYYIELVPNQNSFGHFENWLKHEEYKYLAETPNGFKKEIFDLKYGMTLVPGKDSLKFIESLYKELLPNFKSKLFNVGCDETWELGMGKSKKEADKVGVSRIYIEYLKKIYALVKKYKHTMMYWGDIVLHHPELISELPKDAIALNWGYEANHPFNKECKKFKDANIPFYVCPGTSSWSSLIGRADNCVANLKNAAKNGLKYGAVGYLNTDWGDHGHHQYNFNSYIGILGGAAYSWNYNANKNVNFVDALNLFVVKDKTGVTGQLIWDAGNFYKIFSGDQTNSTITHHLLFSNRKVTKSLLKRVPLKELKKASKDLDVLIKKLKSAKPESKDAKLLLLELKNSLDMVDIGLKKGLWIYGEKVSLVALRKKLNIVQEKHKKLWLARNRVGGLKDGIRRLSKSIYKLENFDRIIKK